jgi:hypothetical protein
MEIKRASELCLCSLLKELLPDLTFLPAKGGGDDVTPVWVANKDYLVGDILKSPTPGQTHVIVVINAGNSGPTPPAFDDIPGSIFTGPPDYQTTPYTIVTKIMDSGIPIPPFATIMFEPAEKTMAQEDTDLMHGILVWVTRADNTDVIYHSQSFKRIYDALQRVGNGYDIMRRLMVHGVDITNTTEFSDPEREAHGDTIEFLMGVTAKDAQV